MNANDRTIVGVLERIADCLCGTSGIPSNAKSDPNEEVLILFAEGHGAVRQDGRGVSVAGTITGAAGEPVGKVVLSWESEVKDEKEFLRRPSSPKVRLDERGPLQAVPPITRVQGHWSFNDGSTLTAVGVGVSSVDTLQTGIHNAKDAAALFVTEGTGRYQGAAGLGTIIGSVPFSAGEKFFNNPGFQVVQKTIQTFRFTGTAAK